MFAEDSSRTLAGELTELGCFMLGCCSVFLKGLLKKPVCKVDCICAFSIPALRAFSVVQDDSKWLKSIRGQRDHKKGPLVCLVMSN